MEEHIIYNAVAPTSDTKEVREINPDILGSISLKMENNLDDYIIMFIDAQMKTSEDCQCLLNDLKNLVSSSVHDFDDIESIQKFVRANEMMKIFLIISGSLGEVYSNRFIKLSQIECTYVFCHDRTKHDRWANGIQKVRGVFDNKNELLKTICRDVKNLTNRWSFVHEHSFQKASTNDGQLHNLFIKILVHLPKTPDTWQNMLQEFRLFYKRHPAMLEKINDFEKEYTPCKAIYYYSQDSFIYRIINYALRTHDMNIIIKFQPYIRDLYHELKKRYVRHKIDCYKKQEKSPIQVLYRGQYMKETELDQLKDRCRSRNSLILLSTFGSASLDPSIAMQYVSDGRSDPEYVPCIYEIIVPVVQYSSGGTSASSPSQYYNDIADVSAMPKEQEVLFNVATIFQVKYIGKSSVERPWVPIILELYLEDREFISLWNSLEKRIHNERSEMTMEALRFLQEQWQKKNDINWSKWLDEFKRKCASHKLPDESLAVIMYQCLADDESNAKAIELCKQVLMKCDPFTSISYQEPFGLLMNQVVCGTPARRIAVYELFFEPLHNCPDLFEYDFNMILQAFKSVAKAYEELCVYNENAFRCYQEALIVAEINSDDRFANYLKKIIDDFYSKKSSRKCDYKTKQKKESTLNMVPSSIESRMQPIDMTLYETEHDQWFSFLTLRKLLKETNLEKRAIGRLTILEIYLRTRENRLNNCDLIMYFHIPSGQQSSNNSTLDLYKHVLSKICSHLHDDIISVAEHKLNLWRYEKFMLEWLSLNDVKRLLRFYPSKNLYVANVTTVLDRVIEKLQTLIIYFTLIIVISRGEIKPSRLNFVKIGQVNVPKLIFFDDRDEVTHDTFGAELKHMAQQKNITTAN